MTIWQAIANSTGIAADPRFWRIRMSDKPGIIVLFGSGETSSSGQKVFDWLFRQLGAAVQAASHTYVKL
jgi:hypothetical protein